LFIYISSYETESKIPWKFLFGILIVKRHSVYNVMMPDIIATAVLK